MMSTGVASISQRAVPVNGSNAHAQRRQQQQQYGTLGVAAAATTTTTTPAATATAITAVRLSVSPSPPSFSSSLLTSTRSSAVSSARASERLVVPLPPSSPPSSSLLSSSSSSLSSSSRVQAQGGGGLVQDVIASLKQLKRAMDLEGRAVISTIDDDPMDGYGANEGEEGEIFPGNGTHLDIQGGGNSSGELEEEEILVADEDNESVYVLPPLSSAPSNTSTPSFSTLLSSRSLLMGRRAVAGMARATMTVDMSTPSPSYSGSPRESPLVLATPSLTSSLASSQSSNTCRSSTHESTSVAHQEQLQQALQQQQPVDPDRPRWTEAARRAVEELREMSREEEEHDKEESGRDAVAERAEAKAAGVMITSERLVGAAQSKERQNMIPGNTDKRKAESALMPYMDAEVPISPDTDDDEEKKKEEDMMWSARGMKRARRRHPHSHRPSLLFEGEGEGSTSTVTTTTTRLSIPDQSLWLQDIERTQLDDTSKPIPRPRALTAAGGALDAAYYRDRTSGYPTAKAILQDILSSWMDAPMTLLQELEGRAWMFESPIVLKPERIQ